MRDIDTDPPCTLTNIVFVLWRAQEVFFFAASIRNDRMACKPNPTK